MDRLAPTFVACAILAGCTSPDAVLITVTADDKVEQYELFVRDDASGEVFFRTGFKPVTQPGDPSIDLTADELKIALKLSRGGDYTLLLVGAIGDVGSGKFGPSTQQFFWAGRTHVAGATNVSARLLHVPGGDDHDGDLWPDATDFPSHVPAAVELYGSHLDLLDCDDKIDHPMTSTGMMLKLLAADINPFAPEICGDGYDEDCNGDADEKCIDADGDHDFKGSDCDDNDPKRHHATDIDPFPDPPNCCGYSLGKPAGSPDANKDFLCGAANCYASSCACDQLLCPMKRCGDGIDESCAGADTPCVVDDDCDGYPAPPMGNDCDDHDPNVHPNASEPCNATKDLNCDGIVGGCVPCDLDGDGFERNDPQNGCPTPGYKHGTQFDCNDYDSGVFPGQTTACGGTEDGTTTIGMVACALRGNCRRVYEATGTTGTPRVGSFGQTVGDADCDGKAYDGCPTPACDADGDGWPNANPGCNPNNVPIDCNDNDPTVFPSAPDKCGNGIAENCVADMPCSDDADGDGYNKGADCDDTNPSIHPWALELCNGVDDDCDQLIDEGNPDPAGKPLVASGAVFGCTDNDLGECGKQKGACVCSSQQPMSVQGAQRTACPGDTVQPKPPRCFGAGQPHPQSCDFLNQRDDDCDGRVDDPQGKNLAVKGMACGVSVGQCKAGLITGCDYSQTNCFTVSPFNLLPKSDSGWVCSNIVCPQAELCNGLDDDCDGKLAGDPQTPPVPGLATVDEYDHDGDKFLACSGCPATLAATLLGCGDCDDTSAAVHPGAKELCNGVDDDCSSTTADGSGECPGTSFPDCCSAERACRSLQNDFANCGTCGKPCSALTANACGGDNCLCGTNPACAGGNYCNGTSCLACNDSKHCGAGCVDCTAGGNVCKTDGTTCTGCNSDTDCPSTPKQLFCNAGTCLATRPVGKMCSVNADCTMGNCVDGYCCNQACNGGCDVCNATPGMCTTVGVGQPGANPSCAPYLCGAANACPTTCSHDGDCAANAFCGSDGHCHFQQMAGGACKPADCKDPLCRECSTGNCVDGVCCMQTSCTASSCTSGMQTTFSCATPTAGSCTATTTACGITYTCGASLCNSSCSCGTAPCASANCASGNFCNGSACVACTTARFCGASCTNCLAIKADTCAAGGVCQCGSTAPCGANADSCNSNLCKCGSALACTGLSDTCRAATCVCGALAGPCSAKSADNCNGGVCQCGTGAACSGTSDTCQSGGSCGCGPTGPPCNANKTCVNGTCQ
jgi:hypothetical protein